jgi:regulatory protein
MKITDISAQKHKNRLNIYVDGGFYAGISEEAAGDLGLYIGKEIDERDLSKVQELDDYYKALSRALNYLSIRKHSKYEIRTKLMKYYSLEVTQKAINRLLTLKYLDDLDFAETYIRYRKAAYGNRKIQSELIKKGINKDIITIAFQSFNNCECEEVIIGLINKKDRPELDINKRREKVMRYLIYKGFDYSEFKHLVFENIKE